MARAHDNLRAAAELVTEHLREIREFAMRWKTYYTGEISEELIVHWLLQFGDTRSVYLAFKLLRHIQFVDNDMLNQLLTEGYSRVPEEERKDAYLSAVGKSYDSGSVAGYGFTKSLGLSEAELARRWMSPQEALDNGLDIKGRVFVIVDDNITSGEQLSRYLEEMDPTYNKEKREHFLKPLSPESFAQLQGAKLRFVMGIALGQGAHKAQETAHSLGLDVTVVSGSEDLIRWLEYGTRPWSNAGESNEIKERIASLSRLLFADKNWEPQLLETRLFGHGNSQKLTVFAHNIPKSLPSPFWKTGTVNGKTWMPLFPERSEWKKHREEIVNADPALRMLAHTIVGGGFDRAEPHCSVGVEIDGKLETHIKLALPETSSHDELFARITSKKDWIELTPKPAPSQRDLLLQGGLAVYGAVRRNAIIQYNQEVLEFNRALDESKKHLRGDIEIIGRFFRLPLRVHNKGSAPATNVRLLLELGADIDFVQELPPPTSPPDPPSEPPDFMSSFRHRDLMATLLRPKAPDLSGIKVITSLGRKLLSVPFDQVLQGAIEEKVVGPLFVRSFESFTWPYELLFAEAKTPARGEFVIQPRPEGTFAPWLLEAWL